MIIIRGMTGKHHSEETKMKMQLSHKGQYVSNKTKKKISVRLKNRQFSKKTIEKMSISAIKRFANKQNHPMFGKHHSNKTKIKLHIAKLGNKNPMKRYDVRKKVSATQQGIPLDKLKSFSNYHFVHKRKLKYAEKNKIKMQSKYTCKLCGFIGQTFSLDVHHIDYNPQNNKLDNLVVLCKKCHAKTNVDRKYWRNVFK